MTKLNALEQEMFFRISLEIPLRNSSSEAFTGSLR